MNLTMRFKNNTVTYENIPEAVAARALKWNKPPVSNCLCGRQGYLHKSSEYICDRCMNVEKDFVYDYGTSGSNRHRITGGRVMPYYVEPYRTTIC